MEQEDEWEARRRKKKKKETCKIFVARTYYSGKKRDREVEKKKKDAHNECPLDRKRGKSVMMIVVEDLLLWQEDRWVDFLLLVSYWKLDDNCHLFIHL